MDGSRIFIDENVARLAMCEMLWNPCVGVVGANNTKVMHQGIWTWSCTLRGGWVACVRIKSGYEFG